MTFTVTDENGREIVCDALCTFDSDETGKSYILYTDRSTDEQGRQRVYASIYNSDAQSTEFLPIETEQEWQMIETVLEELTAEFSSDS